MPKVRFDEKVFSNTLFDKLLNYMTLWVDAVMLPLLLFVAMLMSICEKWTMLHGCYKWYNFFKRSSFTVVKLFWDLYKIILYYHTYKFWDNLIIKKKLDLLKIALLLNFSFFKWSKPTRTSALDDNGKW